MTVNKKELLIYKLTRLYKDKFKDKRKLKDLTYKQMFNLFSKISPSVFIVWHRYTIRHHKKNLSDLPYHILEKIDDAFKDIEVQDNQISTLIKIAIEYERWDRKFKRTYKSLKISRIFNFMSDIGLPIPNDFYRSGIDLETSKLIELVDTEFLNILADTILR